MKKRGPSFDWSFLKTIFTSRRLLSQEDEVAVAFSADNVYRDHFTGAKAKIVARTERIPNTPTQTHTRKSLQKSCN